MSFWRLSQSMDVVHERTNTPATGQQEESDQTKAGMNSQYQI